MTAMLPTIATVIVHYGDPAPTGKCLRAVLACDGLDGPVTVVSNGPPPIAGALLQTIEESAPSGRIRLLQMPNNRGYAAAANWGMAVELEANGADMIWLLNNDTTPEPGAFAALRQCARASGGKTIIGSTLVDMESTNHVQTAGGGRYQAWSSRLSLNGAGGNRSNLPAIPDTPIDYVHGASILIPTDALRDCGMLNERYFLYYEELDFCHRALAHGYRLSWCREAVVRHKGGSAVRSAGPDSFREYYENRSTILFTRLHHPLLLPLVLGVRIVAKTVLYVRRNRLPLFGTLFKAVTDGLTGRLRRPAQ